MIITISKNNFLRALQTTEKIISRNLNLPILNNILLKTDKGRLKLSSTNLEIGINYWIGSKIKEEGEIAVPSKIITDFIQNIQDEKITLTTRKNTLLINSDHYKTQILGFETKDFPIIPEIKEKPVLKIRAQILKNAFLSVVDSTAISETRIELTGVYTQLGGSGVEFAATDGFRLAEKSILYENDQKNEINSFIIPRSTAFEIIRILSDLDEDINISLSDNQIKFSGNDFYLISRLIDGQYPDYKKVIPEKFISRAVLNRDDFQKQIRLSSIFSSSIFDIKLQVQNDKTIILAKNQDRGEINSSISSILKNEPFDVSVNYHYLLDGLKVVNSQKVVLEFTGNGSPLIIKPEEGKDFLYLIMPLRQ